MSSTLKWKVKRLEAFDRHGRYVGGIERYECPQQRSQWFAYKEATPRTKKRQDAWFATKRDAMRFVAKENAGPLMWKPIDIRASIKRRHREAKFVIYAVPTEQGVRWYWYAKINDDTSSLEQAKDTIQRLHAAMKGGQEVGEKKEGEK